MNNEETVDKIFDFINNNQGDKRCKEGLANKFHFSLEDAEHIIFEWAIGNRNNVVELLNNTRVVWSGTVSSESKENNSPITVLTLETTFEKSEFNEGCTDALIDFKIGKSMESKLNYPFSPYARGYVETYRSFKNNQ